MCGRYSLTKKEMRIISKLPPGELQFWFRERFNIAPTEEVPVIVLEEGRLWQREISWGLRPPWSKRPLINAQAGTLLQKPTFRDAFQTRRCLVPADGFYEWRKPDKTPFWFTQPNREAFCFAGFWDRSPPPESRQTFIIITVAASSVVRPVHHRMPFILAPSQYDDWLTDSNKAAALLLEPGQVELRSEVAPPHVNRSTGGQLDLC
jgi:putative SOS response-associated peptidase YedK